MGVTAAARSLTAPPPRSPGQPSGARGSVQSSRSLRTLCPSFASGDPALLGVLLLRPVHIHYLGHTSSLAHPEVSLLGPVPSHPPPSTSCACDSRPPTPARARAHTHTLRHTLLGSRPEPARCSVLAWASPVPACADLSICMTPSPGDGVPAAAGRSSGSPAAPAGAWQGLRRHPERAHWFVGAGSPGRPPHGPGGPRVASTDSQVQSRVRLRFRRSALGPSF